MLWNFKNKYNIFDKKIILAPIFVMLSVLLIYFRIPCDDDSLRIRTTVLYSFLFFVTTPCFYLCFKILFEDYLSIMFTIFYIILTLFPYKLLYSVDVNLCRIFVYPTPKIFIGTNGIWVIVFYIFLSILVTSAYWFYKNKSIFPIFQRKKVLIYILLLLIAMVQVLPRLGQNCTKCVDKNLHREEIPRKPSGKEYYRFYGYCYCGSDYGQHTLPSGMFKGVEHDSYKGTVINRRGLAPYLYSQISMFIHPYITAIIINGIFYFVILLSGYHFAKYLGLGDTIAITYSILLSANHFILFQATVPYFYLQYSTFIILILFLIFRLQIFNHPGAIKNQLLFCFVLACSGLTWDPYIFSALILCWGFFNAIGMHKDNIKKAFINIAQSIFLALIPIVSLYIWEWILKYYNLEGPNLNVVARESLLKNLFLIPEYYFQNSMKFFMLVKQYIYKIIIENPMNSVIEYWSYLGLLGVISCFFFLPRYLGKEQKRGIYACYIAAVSLTLIAALAAAIPGFVGNHYVFITPERSNNAFPVLILAQSVGIFHIIKIFCDKIQIFNRDIIVIAIAVCIYLLSFLKLLFL